MYFFHTSIFLFLRLLFSIKARHTQKKKIVKVIEDDIYDKLLEIYKGNETVVEAIPFSGSHFF